VLPAEKAALCGNEHTRVDGELGKRKWKKRPIVFVDPRFHVSRFEHLRVVYRIARVIRPGSSRPCSLQRPGGSGDVIRRRAAATPYDLGALFPPLKRKLCIAVGADVLVEAPSAAGHIAQIGIDAKR
jgi:hypothetical protein